MKRLFEHLDIPLTRLVYECNQHSKRIPETDIIDIYGKDVWNSAKGCLSILYHIYLSGNYGGIHDRLFILVDDKFSDLNQEVMMLDEYETNKGMQRRIERLETSHERLIKRLSKLDEHKIYDSGVSKKKRKMGPKEVLLDDEDQESLYNFGLGDDDLTDIED